MAARPSLTIVQLSESFDGALRDLAEEMNLECVYFDRDEEIRKDSLAVVVAAGGEEDRGLDHLLPFESIGVPKYLVGALPSHRFAIEAVRRGADDYFAFPQDFDLFRRTIKTRVESFQESAQVSEPTGAVEDPFDELIGNSRALKEVVNKARRIVQHGDVTILIGGETGTGKEVLARAIHRAGPRAGRQFVAINCAAIPSELLESELFGHERGAFTDAYQTKKGLFEEAEGGTLVLDEIGHLPLHLQGKLLRALEERRIRRVGDNQTRPIDVRIIAATHVDLEAAARRGEFREDLYYRLNVVALRLPPLRERDDDIRILAEHFASTTAERYKVEVPVIGDGFLAALRNYSWPGNVRELRYAIERAILLSPPGTLDPAELGVDPNDRSGPQTSDTLPFPARLRDITRAAAQATLELHDGNKSAAARQLGISRSRLARILEDREGDFDA